MDNTISSPIDDTDFEIHLSQYPAIKDKYCEKKMHLLTQLTEGLNNLRDDYQSKFTHSSKDKFISNNDPLNLAL